MCSNHMNSHQWKWAVWGDSAGQSCKYRLLISAHYIRLPLVWAIVQYTYIRPVQYNNRSTYLLYCVSTPLKSHPDYCQWHWDSTCFLQPQLQFIQIAIQVLHAFQYSYTKTLRRKLTATSSEVRCWLWPRQWWLLAVMTCPVLWNKARTSKILLWPTSVQADMYSIFMNGVMQTIVHLRSSVTSLPCGMMVNWGDDICHKLQSFCKQTRVAIQTNFPSKNQTPSRHCIERFTELHWGCGGSGWSANIALLYMLLT